jgi:6-pyruvoyltetrahydropterin/6-carboxytetrahydropterin synthase
MLETFKEFTFEAAHATPPHSGLHGHSFRVEVFLRGKPDPIYGWSHNLVDVDQVITVLKEKIDHRYLNDVAGLEVPTIENVARWIWEQLRPDLKGLHRVVVRRGCEGQVEGTSYAGRH